MKYEVWFRLVDETKEDTVDFTEEKYVQGIKVAVNNFNIAGEMARNWKHIHKYEIEKNTIKIQFESTEELEKPTKSFRYFSRDLINYSPDFKMLESGGRLLKGVYTGIIDENEVEVTLTDEQMLTTLLHWCMSKELQSAEEKKNN